MSCVTMEEVTLWSFRVGQITDPRVPLHVRRGGSNLYDACQNTGYFFSVVDIEKETYVILYHLILVMLTMFL